MFLHNIQPSSLTNEERSFLSGGRFVEDIILEGYHWIKDGKAFGYITRFALLNAPNSRELVEKFLTNLVKQNVGTETSKWGSWDADGREV